MEAITFDPIATALALVLLTIVAFYLHSKWSGKESATASTPPQLDLTPPEKPRVAELNIYPIKSCAEIRVDSAAVTPRGFEFDRAFQVVSNVDGVWSYCTPRDRKYERLFRVQPAISEDGKRLAVASPYGEGSISVNLEGAPENSVIATAMGGKKHLLEDYGDAASRWLSAVTGVRDVRLVGIGDGTYFLRRAEINPDQGDELPGTSPVPVSLADEAPFLLTTRESIVDLNKRLMRRGKDMVDMRRFRPNIVMEGLRPWEEDAMRRVRIGPVEFRVWQRCGRCAMTTIDRDTLERSGEPLSTLSSFRERENGQRNFGMHLIPVLDDAGSDEIVISVGDDVEILEYDDKRKAEWERLFCTE